MYQIKPHAGITDRVDDLLCLWSELGEGGCNWECHDWWPNYTRHMSGIAITLFESIHMIMLVELGQSG